MGAARQRWVLLASLVGLAFTALTVHAVDTVSAEYGVAAGRDIRDSTITINQTLKPEELQAAVQGALTPPADEGRGAKP